MLSILLNKEAPQVGQYATSRPISDPHWLHIVLNSRVAGMLFITFFKVNCKISRISSILSSFSSSGKEWI